MKDAFLRVMQDPSTFQVLIQCAITVACIVGLRYYYKKSIQTPVFTIRWSQAMTCVLVIHLITALDAQFSETILGLGVVGMFSNMSNVLIYDMFKNIQNARRGRLSISPSLKYVAGCSLIVLLPLIASYLVSAGYAVRGSVAGNSAFVRCFSALPSMVVLVLLGRGLSEAMMSFRNAANALFIAYALLQPIYIVLPYFGGLPSPVGSFLLTMGLFVKISCTIVVAGAAAQLTRHCRVVHASPHMLKQDVHEPRAVDLFWKRSRDRLTCLVAGQPELCRDLNGWLANVGVSSYMFVDHRREKSQPQPFEMESVLSALASSAVCVIVIDERSSKWLHSMASIVSAQGKDWALVKIDDDRRYRFCAGRIDISVDTSMKLKQSLAKWVVSTAKPERSLTMKLLERSGSVH